MGKESKKLDVVVTNELQNTLLDCPKVEFVHFDKDGNHYFTVYEHKAEMKKDASLNGVYGRIKVQHMKDNKDGREFVVRTPDLSTKIEKSYSREDILSAEPTLLYSPSFIIKAKRILLTIIDIMYS